MEEPVKCECGKPMLNVGNLSGVIFTSNPPQWDDVYVCKKCKTKREVRTHGRVFSAPNYDEYREIKDK